MIQIVNNGILCVISESEWKWFRTFFRKLDQQGHVGMKKKRPESQHERLMLSKFLYYR